MSRMAFKLKSTGNKNRKGSSPTSSRSGTPTNSQSSVSDKQQNQEPTIDDPLINDDIKSLQVTEEQLRKVILTAATPFYWNLYYFHRFTQLIKKALPPNKIGRWYLSRKLRVYQESDLVRESKTIINEFKVFSAHL